MELFETIKRNLALCLYFSNQTRVFDVKLLSVYFVAVLVVVSHFLYLFYEAENLTEYVYSVYWTTTMLGVLCASIDTRFETATIFVLIDSDIGETVKESEFKVSSYFSI